MNYFSLDIIVRALGKAASLLKCCLQPAYSAARCGYVQVQALEGGSPSHLCGGSHQLKGQDPPRLRLKVGRSLKGGASEEVVLLREDLFMGKEG